MKIEHVAIWVADLEKQKEFYGKYLGGTAGEKYRNQQTGFESYFISFSSGARLELMHRPGLEEGATGQNPYLGYAHIAFALDTKEQVDRLTGRLREDGYIIAGEPRTTGDGYYESCILDPEGNRVEITC
jgi:lactoylglutathione lyase